jgi:hypothetical protein
MITRSQDRIDQTGEVFTPLALVDEILDKLPKDVWNPLKTFCDPACGDGNFLVRVLQRKIDTGSTPTQALSHTYGVDIMPDNVKECKRRLLNITGDTVYRRRIVNRNIVCADSLKYHFKFDGTPSEVEKVGNSKQTQVEELFEF